MAPPPAISVYNLGANAVTALNNDILEVCYIDPNQVPGVFKGKNNLVLYNVGTTCPDNQGPPTYVYNTVGMNGGSTQTLAITSASSAVDAVPNGSCVYVSSGTNPLFAKGAPILTDQRGVSRPQGTLCDIGAYEYGVFVVNSLSDVTATCSVTGTMCLRNAISLTATGNSVTFSVSGTIALTGPLPIGNAIIIDGSGQSITINGSLFQIFSVPAIGNLSLKALTFTNGLGNSGGAINNLGQVNIAGSTFVGNTATTGGGAIYNHGTLNVANSTFASNTGNLGGAIWDYNGTIHVTSSTFIGNTAQAGNGYGGALELGGSDTLNNSILTGNIGGDCNGSGGGAGSLNNLSSDLSCVGSVATPQGVFTTLANNGGPTQTFALNNIPTSDIVDAIPAGACVYTSSDNNPLFTNGAPIASDQRGASRPQGKLCDIGAYELVVIDSIGIYRSGTFYLRLHNSQGFSDLTVAFNPPGNNLPIVGDWLGSGFDTVGVYNTTSGSFSVCTANDSALCASSANQIGFILGNPNDAPLSGRWGLTATHAGAGVYRSSNGILYMKNALTTGFSDYNDVLGNPGDIGVAGDWTGKGYDSPGVYRPTESKFYLSNQVINGIVFSDITALYGNPGDFPVTGDWIGQGHDGIGLFRQSAGYTYLRNTITTGAADNTFFYGSAGDVPVAGHWQSNYPPVAPRSAPVLVPKTPTPVTPGNGSAPGGNTIDG